MQARYGRLIGQAAAVIILIPLFLAGCTPKIDKHKFAKIGDAAEAAAGAAAGGDYTKFEDALGRLSTEISDVSDSPCSKEEKELLISYERLLGTYQDARLLWRYRMESSLYPWIPQGRIYADERIQAIAGKYGIPMEPHVIEITGRRFETLPADSVRKVLEEADARYKTIRSRMPLF